MISLQWLVVFGSLITEVGVELQTSVFPPRSTESLKTPQPCWSGFMQVSRVQGTEGKIAALSSGSGQAG